MSITQPAPALRQARMYLLEHGDCPPVGIDERLARSWRRSLAAGLLPGTGLADTEHASGMGLRHALASNHDLLAHSRPVMEYLFEQVRSSQSMVILADNRGTLMHTLGDTDFLDKADRVALSSGASWHEQHRGTNAIGTALAEAAGVEIHGGEHFLERNGFLTCAATPIMSASGELMGILDISGDQRSRHPHTLGLVSMAARMIENRLVIATCRCHIRLHLHAHPEGIGSVAEGIIALSEDDWIVGANRQGLALLHLAPPDLGATPLASAIDVRLGELLARHKRRPGQPTLVHLHDGSALFVQVHAEPTALALAPTAKPARAASAITTTDDALARLDAGDTHWHNATDKARRVAGKPIPLLIVGESGVGKELFARATHDSGPRRNGPFVAINCAALPENLIEAELFGYAPGAFTSARREGSPGRLREAHGGTLFLDEIGDMPLTMQTRLLRVLQERQVTPLGGGQPVDVDFSLICATHRKLREEAEKGSFRSDLYYRINGLTLHLPALRERTDFQGLTDRLLAELNPGRDIHLAPDLLAQLILHPWPGNLRQYASVLRTASAMLDPDEDCIAWQHLPDDLAEELTAAPQASLRPPASAGKAQNLDELSRSAIRQALETSSGNISEAARRLGVSRQTLYRKMKA
ncbi:sigma-54-dependent Fis family transcriptional regulator [Propionivibrio sp.]|uniref:sigma-54-dependent Fis family transcriptional regulator n=1 Tax=Propionivibrio sp. TaxID=2212460 RepID=UPI003BF29005